MGSCLAQGPGFILSSGTKKKAHSGLNLTGLLGGRSSGCFVLINLYAFFLLLCPLSVGFSRSSDQIFRGKSELPHECFSVFWKHQILFSWLGIQSWISCLRGRCATMEPTPSFHARFYLLVLKTELQASALSSLCSPCVSFHCEMVLDKLPGSQAGCKPTVSCLDFPERQGHSCVPLCLATSIPL